MTNSKELFHDLVNKITFTSDPDEAKANIHYLLEHRLGITQSDILTGKLISSDLGQLKNDLDRLNHYEPVQYIVGVAYFRNRKFEVNASVLIPRPETELLVQEVLDEKCNRPSIVDVGTGSGCIAVSLSLEIPDATIAAVDISEEALITAKRNAANLNATVNFQRLDVLHQTFPFRNLDYLVSNPPYVREQEKERMEKNVLQFEPHLALFVKDDDPLIFYRTLAEAGNVALKPSGKVVAEINAQLGKETVELFKGYGYRYVQLIKDMEGKERIIKASR